MSTKNVSKSGNMNQMEDIAKAKNLPISDTNRIIEMLEYDMYFSLYRKSPDDALYSEEDKKFNHEINAKIEKHLKQAYGMEKDAILEVVSIRTVPLTLNGAPGQGKTTCYVESCKRVAKNLGLNFIRDVEESYTPSRNDLLLVVQDSAGKTSVLEYALPRAVSVSEKNSKGEVEENVYLKSVLNWRFMCLNKTAGGILLFDDAANASINVQNSFLQVAINKTFGGMKLHNALIGFTANLGSADGTYTNDFSSALRNRTANFYVRDTVENFKFRAYKRLTGTGDLGLINYLNRNADDLSSMPEPGSSAGFNSPRSWDDFIDKMIVRLHALGGRGKGEDLLLSDVRLYAPSMLGPKVGAKVVAYYESLLLGADPIAREAIEKGKLDDKKFDEKYGSGGNADSVTFGYQFASSCADYTTNFIRTEMRKIDATKLDEKEFTAAVNDILTVACEKFGNATEKLLDNEYTFALSHLLNKMASSIDGIGRMTNDGPKLEREYPRHMALKLCSLPECTSQRQNQTVAVMSDTLKMTKNPFTDEELAAESKKGVGVRTRTRTRP